MGSTVSRPAHERRHEQRRAASGWRLARPEPGRRERRRPPSRARSGGPWRARGALPGRPARWRCKGRIGVNERPMKFTRNSTASSGGHAGQPQHLGERRSRRGGSAGGRRRLLVAASHTRTSAPAQSAAVARKVAADPDHVGQEAAQRAAPRRRTGSGPPGSCPRRGRSARAGASDVAMARPSGPIPPNSPTPTRSARSCPTFVTARRARGGRRTRRAPARAIRFWP